MSLLALLCFFSTFLKVFTLSVVQNAQITQSKPQDAEWSKSLRRILGTMANTKLYLTSVARRNVNPYKLMESKTMDEYMARQNGERQSLRNQPDRQLMPLDNSPEPVNTAQEIVIEKELHDAMAKQGSAILKDAWVEKNGENDFLVFAENEHDKFVTIIPNDVYYNVEKKCANWLDDCTLQGIKTRLLEKMKNPYK